MILHGKAALVTGGGRGIGRAISLALAAAGAHVTLTYARDRASAEAAVAAIAAAGGSADCLAMDVVDRASVAKALATAAGRAATEADPRPRLDILVNNAGINKPTDFDAVTDADWDEILAVNLRGPFVCTQEALPYLKVAGASVINIGSVSGQYGGPRTAHYAASKAGLISLGQVAARFGAPFGIRVNTVAAGLINSAMAEAGLTDPAVRQAAAGIPLGRLGLPSEVADVVVFLASEKSAYITAQTINVNGGLYF